MATLPLSVGMRASAGELYVKGSQHGMGDRTIMMQREGVALLVRLLTIRDGL